MQREAAPEEKTPQTLVPPEARPPVAPAGLADPAFYKSLLDHMSDGVYFVDRDRRILYWNEGAFRLTGYEVREMTGRYCYDNTLCHVDVVGNNLCQKGCPLTACVADGAPHQAQMFLLHKYGRRVPVSVRAQPIHGANGEIVGAVEIFSDNRSELAAQSRLKEMERLVFLDQNTQLPNRRYLEMSLQTRITEYHAHNDRFGVLLLDVDHFKEINDRYGHEAGDRALREAGNTLRGVLRSTDVIGRWGGDEFMAIAAHLNEGTLRTLAERCCVLMRQTSFAGGDRTAPSMSVSVGGTLVMQNDIAETLFRRADALMYASKAAGRDRATVG